MNDQRDFGGASSTNTPLLAGETYTGAPSRSESPDVAASCFSDVDGTLYFDFSVNGQDWRTFPTNGYKIVGGAHAFHRAVKSERYFRARFINGSSNQTVFQLCCYFGSYNLLSAPVSQTLGATTDAIVVRSFPSQVDLAEGKLGGVRQRDKFGYTEGLGTAIQLGNPATWVDVWTYGGQRTLPTTSFTPYVASTDAGDTTPVVTLLYQDTDGVEQTVEVTLNGQTPVSAGVAATESYRVNNLGSVLTLGDVHVATTNSFTSGSPDNQDEVVCAFSSIDQQSQLLAFRVPAGKDAIIESINLNLSRASGAAGAADVALEVRNNGGIWRAIRKYQLVTSSAPSIPELITINPLTDVRVRVRDVSDAGSTISGRINYLLVDQ